MKGENLNWDSCWTGSLFKKPENERISLCWVYKGQCNCGPSRPVSIELVPLFLCYWFSRRETWNTVRVIQIFDYTCIELLRPCNTWQELVKLVPEMSVYVTVNVMSKFQWKLQDAGDARTMRYPGKKSGDMEWSQSKKVYISQSKQGYRI